MRISSSPIVTERARPRIIANIMTATQVAIGLAQIGEFSFVVLSIGLAAGVIDAEQFAAVLAVAVASIAASTIGARWSPPQRRRA